ncbi:MAG: LicD family protein [Gammaproteobacteria bacterium]|nr:LicD family protein [Gammaproteobacteria bacterium]
MAYAITLEGKNKLIAESMLRDIAALLDSCSIRYWLEGGTLLGIRRENRLLPWDNDIDLSIMDDQVAKLSTLFSALKKAGYRVRTRHFEQSGDCFKAGDIRLVKIRKKKWFGLSKGEVCLEIFVKYPDRDYCYWEIAGKTKRVPIRFYRSLDSIRFNDYSYSIPALTDEYLSFRYGDWQTPVKEWNTSTDDNALSF